MSLIQAIGLQAVKTFMERQLMLLRVQYLGKKIAAAILQQAGINHQQEVKKARQEAWQEYKAKYFQDTIGKQECPFCKLSSWRI